MTEQASLSTSPRPYHLTVEDFFRLDEAGAFDGLGKTELIAGKVYFLNAQHRPHARMKSALHLELAQALARIDDRIAVLVEATVAMPPHSAPEPDLILTSEPDGDGAVPLPSVRLLIEVADTTQRHDGEIKARLYAANAVPEYWLVDLKAGEMLRMAVPGAAGYAEIARFALGERCAAATIPGLEIVLPS